MGYGRVNPRKRNYGRLSPLEITFFLVGITFAMALLIGGLTWEDADAHNNNVKTGEVKVSTSLYKICDGPNLVYTIASDGIAVSPNDPQCS
jgi:Na+/H+ antiporter NhaA